jgi:hypothetical protein
MKRLGLAQADGRLGQAGSQPPIRLLTRSDERTASIGNTDKRRLSGMQILGHNCRETLATAMSTGVVSRETQLLARPLARRRIGQQDLSRRGTDNEVSHVCARSNFSVSQ